MKNKRKNDWVKFRASAYEIEIWKRAAAEEKISLSRFARMALSSRAKYKTKTGEAIIKIISKNMNKPRTNRRPKGLIYN